MAERVLLLFDDDGEFREQLTSCLEDYGFEILSPEPDGNAVAIIKEMTPEIVVIAADEPDNVGFTLCTRARKIMGGSLPIVLVTSTISERELSLHAKQKLHADLYLDKRELDGNTLLAEFRQLVRLGRRRVVRPVDQDDEAPEEAIGDSEVREAALEGEEPWVAGLLSRGTSGAEVEDADDEDDGPLQRIATMERENERLQAELKNALHCAETSPSSGDHLELREEAAQKDDEIDRLADDPTEQSWTARGRRRSYASWPSAWWSSRKRGGPRTGAH